ncbi:hypothetical protein BC834DRAFT_113330 [Gloeopeniophorella convolvens]|nr:hypothetical protein BC834DRAFT_113330 [Gloeopeniophorella convolvens]
MPPPTATNARCKMAVSRVDRIDIVCAPEVIDHTLCPVPLIMLHALHSLNTRRDDMGEKGAIENGDFRRDGCWMDAVKSILRCASISRDQMRHYILKHQRRSTPGLSVRRPWHTAAVAPYHCVAKASPRLMQNATLLDPKKTAMIIAVDTVQPCRTPRRFFPTIPVWTHED